MFLAVERSTRPRRYFSNLSLFFFFFFPLTFVLGFCYPTLCILLSFQFISTSFYSWKGADGGRLFHVFFFRVFFFSIDAWVADWLLCNFKRQRCEGVHFMFACRRHISATFLHVMGECVRKNLLYACGRLSTYVSGCLSTVAFHALLGYHLK